MNLIYFSTCKNKANAEKRVAQLRRDAYHGHGAFGGHTRYIVKGRRIYYFDGWC